MPGGGAVHAPEYIEHRGLARAAGPHDGHELAWMYIKVYTAQRMHGLVAHLEVPADVLYRKYGVFSSHFVFLDDFTLISVALRLEDNIFVGDVWRNHGRNT